MPLAEIETTRGTDDAALPERTTAPALREVRHEYTRTLPPLLSQLGVSLLVSTYQAGKIAAVGVAAGELTLSYHNFERAMGMAVRPDALAVAARAQVWFLHSAPVHAGEPPYYHWHLELLPRTARPAGLEWGYGCHITTVTPERAAAPAPG